MNHSIRLTPANSHIFTHRSGQKVCLVCGVHRNDHGPREPGVDRLEILERETTNGSYYRCGHYDECYCAANRFQETVKELLREVRHLRKQLNSR